MSVPMKEEVGAMSIRTLTQRILRFYLDGFRAMVLGKTLWKIIAIKLVVIFGILKLFFFPDFLGTKFATDSERADHVLHEITLGQDYRGDLLHKDSR